jgi:hypothetical protein
MKRDPRLATAEDLRHLASAARDLLLEHGATFDEGARVPAADTAAALAEHGYAAHAAALDFDACFAGLEVTVGGSYFCFGVHASLEGKFRSLFEQGAAFIDDSDEETIRDTTPNAERAHRLTPIGSGARNALALYMDSDGSVYWHSNERYELGAMGNGASELFESLRKELG